MIVNNKYIQIIARLVLGVLFLLVGFGKIDHAVSFANEIGNYDMLPDLYVNISAIVLPWIEVILGLMLIVGYKIKTSALLTGGLLVVFVVAVASAFARGLNIDCGCYSQYVSQKVGWSKIIENSILTILAFFIFISKNNSLSLDRFLKK